MSVVIRENHSTFKEDKVRDANFEKEKADEFIKAKEKAKQLIREGIIPKIVEHEVKQLLFSGSESGELLLDLIAGFAVYYKYGKA